MSLDSVMLCIRTPQRRAGTATQTHRPPVTVHVRTWLLLHYYIRNVCCLFCQTNQTSILRNLHRRKKTLHEHNCGSAPRTRESGPVLELSDLQHALAVLAVQDVRRRNVIQGVVLQGWRRGVKLGVEGQWVGRAVSGSRADGANPLGSGLHGYGGTLVEAVLFCPENQIENRESRIVAVYAWE